MQNAKCDMQTLNTRTWAVFSFCTLHFALLLSLTACSARAKAQTLADGPPLTVPIAPAHQVALEQIVEAPPSELPPAAEPEKPAPRPAATPPNRATAARQAEPRTETPAPAPAPAAAPQPPPEAPVIRAQPAASAGDERKAQDLMKKAAGDLERVDYGKLSKDGKAQYDQSKRFSEQAQQAIRERNFVYALTLADKAATLAAELVR